jgi:hypothetical protein
MRKYDFKSDANFKEYEKYNNYFNKDLDYNLFCIFFQIYATLDSLKEIYTHYDLHPWNILIKFFKNPLKITYKMSDGSSVVLVTNYFPIIIDYGRSYINCLKLDKN